MTDISINTSSALSLLSSLDLYWKSRLLVDYSKNIHNFMILDDHLHEEGYLVQEEVIYHHGRIFFSRAFKLEKKLLRRAYKELCFSHMHSMRIYNIIMRSFDWEGFKEELHQHFQECMSYVELGQPGTLCKSHFSHLFLLLREDKDPRTTPYV